MRIIVTHLGDELIKVMSEENRALKQIRKEKSELKAKKSLRKGLDKQKRRKIPLLKRFVIEESEDLDPMNNFREVSIRQKKLNIPKNVAERYNTDIKGTTLLPTLPLALSKKANLTNSIDGTISINKLTLKDIINEDSYKDLIGTMKQNRILKDRNIKIDGTNFRTIFEEQDIYSKLNSWLNKEINPDRINLMKYINQKTKISDIFIKKIAEYDEEKINRMNKISQIVFHNEEQESLFKEILKAKIKAKHNREKLEYRANINGMGDNIREIGHILKNYEKKINNRDRYVDIHIEIQKNYWEKYNTKKLQRRGKYKQGNSISGTENNVTKFINTSFE